MLNIGEMKDEYLLQLLATAFALGHIFFLAELHN
jgi:hypothetical protein